MDDYRLFSPPHWLPWYLYPVWPLIWLRIRRLKAWFRAAGGPGSQMLWGVGPRGRVVIISLSDDLSGREPGQKPFTVQLSCSFRTMLSGEALNPLSRPAAWHLPGPFAARAPGMRRKGGNPRLPLPDT